MPDYIYLLENRLSPDQRNALHHLRDAAREAGMILFLTGDAVRDLTSGHAVHELEVAVHGNALKLKKPLEKLGAKVWGEDPDFHSLFLCFPGTVRVDVVTTHRVDYPSVGKAVYHQASIQEDLRRRDFTVNAMAISLNEGSFGLLMDPLNGAADIEARHLRLVSNYGFLEEPSLLIRVTRYKARLGWDMDSRTQTRFEKAKAENVIEHLAPLQRSRELEQIGHEEEGLRVLKALEEEGWMKVLYPAWTSAKADETRLRALHDLAVELQMQGVHPDMSAAQMELLTSGLSAKDLSGLKKTLLRPGFVEEWDSLDSIAAGFQKVLLTKQNATPSASYKQFTSYDPEAVLWLGFTSKSSAVQDRYHQFLKVWPEARQRIPHLLMQEMRITPELPGYAELIHNIFLELIDGKLTTPEEMRAWLEPHSPPAPPPQVTVKRSRVKREAKMKVIDEDEEEESDDLGGDDDLDLAGDDDMDLDLGKGDDAEEEEESEGEDDEEAAPVAKGQKAAAVKAEKPAKPEKTAKPEKPVQAQKPVAKEEKPAAKPAKPAPSPAPPVAKAKAAPPAKVVPAKVAHKAKPAPPAKKAAPAPKGKPVKSAAVKVSAKAHAKAPAKAPAKAHGKAAPAKGKPAKPAAKKPAAKVAKKK